MSKSIRWAGATALLLCAGCNMGSSDAKRGTDSRGAASPDVNSTAQSNAAQGQANGTSANNANASSSAKTNTQSPVATPKQQNYSMDGIKTIPDECARPKVVLATAPESLGKDYPWPITRQALLANQQFRIISGFRPNVLGQISLATWQYGEISYALVATCADGTTCNQLAAMYKAVVRSSQPEVFCEQTIRGMSPAPVAMFPWNDDPTANLPKEGDVVALCARLSACMIATDQSTPGDPFLECQKAPAKFKTECAKRYPCAEVLACMGK